MLPDLPTLKNQIRVLLDRIVKAKAREQLGVFSEVPMHVVHEGSKMQTIRADGSSDVSEMITASAEVSVDMRDTPTLTIEDRIAMMDDLAGQMARQMQGHFFGVLDQVLGEAGQVVDGKDKDIVEVLFETLDRVETDFDREGRPKSLSVAASPQVMAKFQEAMRRIESDPKLAARFENLMQRKKESWLARETSRKLVG